ncbi:hypothetical protein EXU29_18385 [Acinetobacter wuhouensis]|nr:hypothetical protein EXU29_18385 [Acinetobacter wuhouensis]
MIAETSIFTVVELLFVTFTVVEPPELVLVEVDVLVEVFEELPLPEPSPFPLPEPSTFPLPEPSPFPLPEPSPFPVPEPSPLPVLVPPPPFFTHTALPLKFPETYSEPQPCGGRSQ